MFKLAFLNNMAQIRQKLLHFWQFIHVLNLSSNIILKSCAFEFLKVELQEYMYLVGYYAASFHYEQGTKNLITSDRSISMLCISQSQKINNSSHQHKNQSSSIIDNHHGGSINQHMALVLQNF